MFNFRAGRGDGAGGRGSGTDGAPRPFLLPPGIGRVGFIYRTAGQRESVSRLTARWAAWRPPSGDRHRVCRQHCPARSLHVYFHQCLLANLGTLDKVLGGPGDQDPPLRRWVSSLPCPWWLAVTGAAVWLAALRQ